MKAFKLENEPRIEQGFKTPDHYFDNFSAKVLQQLPDNEPKVISIFQKRKTLIMMIAAVLILSLMIPIYISISANSKELDEAALENYLSYQTNLNQYDLISELKTEDISKMQPVSSPEDQAIEDILATNSDIEHLITE
ncbi:hypothetical protein IWX84_000501 [Flavobacterium sp. CG_9.10]|uniref:hypothetical protein n=1 Tax=Flavobacterium sp. CG_9.10 TaxID=2787729 RepID=UPI0018CA59C5|nr:hypothetical protein [Flavobacterium sp. CG_9.10]MBG6109642.1 hypothetical protein [Flavobacterium sp. CG_9.10]